MFQDELRRKSSDMRDRTDGAVCQLKGWLVAGRSLLNFQGLVWCRNVESPAA